MWLSFNTRKYDRNVLSKLSNNSKFNFFVNFNFVLTNSLKF